MKKKKKDTFKKYRVKLNLPWGRAAICSACVSVLILVCCYFQNNIPYPFMLTFDGYYWVQKLIDRNSDKPISDDILLVSTSSDIAVAPNCYGTGNNYFSDRHKVLHFLHRVDSVGGYKALFYDLELVERFDSVCDAQLVTQLCHMNNVIVARKREKTGSVVPFINYSLNAIAADNTYKSTILKSGFSRYPLLLDGEPSVALRIYNMEKPNSKIQKFGIFYIQDGRLCYNCPVLQFSGLHCTFDGYGNPQLTGWYLGSEILTMSDDIFAEAIKDKFIILGNFEDDLHDTYMGKISGSILPYVALSTLRRGANTIPYWRILVEFLIYFIICFALLLDWNTYIGGHIHSKFGMFCYHFLSYNVLLWLVSIFAYLFGVIICTLLPAFIYSAVKLMLSLNSKLTYEK